jgi:glutamate/aspartate transport system substrate-binding protein
MSKSLLAAIFTALTLCAGGTSAQSLPNTLAKIKAAKAINVAYSPDSLPFSFIGANNEPAGYSIDLCKRVIAQIARAISEANLKINWIPGAVNIRLEMISAGKADLECANTTQTQGRLVTVDFSNLIFIDGGGILVKAGAPINAIPDLAGKKIAVLKQTTTEARLNETLRRRLVNATVVQIENANDGITMLETGAVDAYAGDKIKLIGLLAQSKEPARLAMLVEELSFEPYAMALPRNDAGYRLEVNRALTQVYMSGDIETIFAQWLGKLGRPSGLLAVMYLLNSIPE